MCTSSAKSSPDNAVILTLTQNLYIDPSSDLLSKILDQLSARQKSSISLQELTCLVSQTSKFRQADHSISSIRRAQGIVLDALIMLHDLGYIFLDPVTDYNRITYKGLLKTSKRAHCN